MTYRLMKRVIERGIENGDLDTAATMDKLDAFLAGDRITTEEYKELSAMVKGGGEA